MKKLKNDDCVGMVVLSLMSALTFSVFSAGNVSDTIINISARSNNGGTPCRSIWREKKDYTSVWCGKQEHIRRFSECLGSAYK